MKWLFTGLLCLSMVVGAQAGEQELKHFTGGIALTELGYGLGGFFWDKPSAGWSSETVPTGFTPPPKGIVDPDAYFWKKCVMGVGLTIAVGMITDQENEDMAWMFGGSFADIIFKSAWRAWVNK